jgi:hypothetical protein
MRSSLMYEVMQYYLMQYKYLSDLGEIYIIQRDDLISILFFESMGILGEYSAITYRSDDTPPKNYSDDGCDRAWRISGFDEHWYRCNSD